MVKRYARRAAVTTPSLRTKRVNPRTIRHSTATHLLRSGVDINTIRIWLGHASLQTTHLYAESDLKIATADGGHEGEAAGDRIVPRNHPQLLLRPEHERHRRHRVED